MNMAAIQYKDARQDTTQIPAETALEMGTRLARRPWGWATRSRIEPGKRADLVLFDTAAAGVAGAVESREQPHLQHRRA